MFYNKTVLDNGVTVISERMEGVRSVALGLWVRVGNRDEAVSEYGISHFMEHMLFKGTPTRNAQDISVAFDSLGAELNAFTSREYTCFYARMIDDNLPKGFEILSDMLVNAAFRQEDIDPEREVVIEEINRAEDGPEDRVYDVFSDAMFPTHPLGRPVLGNRERVGSFVTADMKSYHDRHYTSENIFVVCTGSVDHDALVEMAQRYLADVVGGPRLKRTDEPEASRKLFACEQKDCEQAHILFGTPTIDAAHDARFAHAIMDAALGGGMSSRLFTEIREKRGLVYSVYTMSSLNEDCGSFSMYAGTRPENVGEILEVTRKEFARFVNEGIACDELQRIKEMVCGNLVLGMESTRAHMTRLGRLACASRPITSLDEVLERYRSVTVDEVNEIANKILTQEPTIAIVSPYGQTEIERML